MSDAGEAVRISSGPPARHRPGNIQFACNRVRCRRSRGGDRSTSFRSVLSARRLGRAGPGGPLAVHLGRWPRGDCDERRRPVVHCRHRHCEPAGDDPRLGRRDRGTVEQCHRLAGSADRGALRPGTQRGHGAGTHRSHRPLDRPLLLQYETRVAAIAPGLGSAGESREDPLRNRRQFPDLAPDQGRMPRHRCHQCLADPVVRHRPPGLERTGARLLRRAGVGAARCPRLRWRVRHCGSGVVRRRDPDLWRCRRPAGSLGRPSMPHARAHEEHLRHGLFPDREYRCPTGALPGPAAHHRWLPGCRRHLLRRGREHFQRRRCHQVAARQGGIDRDGRGVRSGCPTYRRRHRRGLRGARVHRIGRAALAARRARSCHGTHTGYGKPTRLSPQR